MVNNGVSFIISSVILMEKCGFLGSPSGCVQRDRIIWCHPLCLVSNGRQVLLGGIRLGGSAIGGIRA